MPVEVGDVDGRDTLYDRSGSLIAGPGEEVLRVGNGWDMNVRRPWRRLLPRILFMGFNGRVVSKLYVTSFRIVLVREVDTWRELAGEMTILGAPTAAGKEARLRNLRQSGARQYCAVRPDSLRLVSSRRFVKHGSRIDLQLIGSDSEQYAISFWKSDGTYDSMVDLLESRFHR